MTELTKILLEESEMPTQWYNVVPDLPAPPPPALHPGTHQPATAEDFAPLFPMALIEQEVSTERYIDIPGEILDVYRLWRPTPLFRAHRLEKLLDTPAKIFYKYEGVSPAGSHKPNTSVPQAYYNAKAGVKKLTTETGAGQWGSALAFAGSQFGLEVEVWQVRSSYDQKPDRQRMMRVWGGNSPSQPFGDYGSRPTDSQPRSRLTGQSWHSHFRGGDASRSRSRRQVRAGFGVEPRAHAPDRHRRGGFEADGEGRRDAGPARRMHGGRI